MKWSKILPFAIIGAGGIYIASKFATGKALQKLKFFNPRVKLESANLLNVSLQITLDIQNPGPSDVLLDYFTGDIAYNGSKLSSFTFSSHNKNGGQTILKARQQTAVPFTVVVSNLSALSVLVNLIKALASGSGIPTAVISVNGSIYAGGYEYPVKFGYDVKKKAPVAGIGKTAFSRRLLQTAD